MSIFQDSSSLLNESRKIQRQIQEELNYIQEGKRAARRNREKQRVKQSEDEKEPKQRSAFRSSARPKGVASPETVDMAKTVSMISKNEPKSAEKKEPTERKSFRANVSKKGVAPYELADKARAVKLVTGRQIPKKDTQVSQKEEPKPKEQKISIKPKKSKKETKVVSAVPTSNKRQRVSSTKPATQPKKKEVKSTKPKPYNPNLTLSDVKQIYRSYKSDKSTKSGESTRNRDLIAKGVSGGIKKYAGKIKDAGSRVVSKIKKFFGREDVDLLFASQVLLEYNGYSTDEIEIILEWIGYGQDGKESLECLNILENSIDAALVSEYITENYIVETEEELYTIINSMTNEEYNLIVEEKINEEIPVDRRLKSNKLVSKTFKRKKPTKPSY